MLATNKQTVKPTIVLLGQKGKADQIELQPEEGPFESWLAVAQDLWGPGNLTPLDDIFASAAIRSLAMTNKSLFGTVSFQLGERLFRFSRETATWIDAYECESGLSQIQKRPKDKIKLNGWRCGASLLKTARFTKLAILYPSAATGSSATLPRECADALKPGGDLFLADLVAGKSDGSRNPFVRVGNFELRTSASYRLALTDAGLTLASESDMTDQLKAVIRRGLCDSLDVLTKIRALKEPWKKQRLAAYVRELQFAATLYCHLDSGQIAAAGIAAQKK